MTNEWPFSDQRKNPTARARHVASMYRTALGLVNPTTMAQLDAIIEQYGERWIRERTFDYDDMDLLKPEETAEILGVSVNAIRQYRLRNRLPGVKTPDGWRYRVKDIKAFGPVNLGRKKKDEEEAMSPLPNCSENVYAAS